MTALGATGTKECQWQAVGLPGDNVRGDGVRAQRFVSEHILSDDLLGASYDTQFGPQRRWRSYFKDPSSVVHHVPRIDM